MNPIRRELINGLLVLVVASLLSAAFSAFQVSFNLQLWVLILIGIAIAVGFYIVFEIALGYMASTQDRETEWLKRVGTPARLELNQEGKPAGLVAVFEALKAMRTGTDYTVLYYYGAGGGGETLGDSDEVNAVRGTLYGSILEDLKRGRLRDYKRIICFDRDVLANDHELKSGILRVGEGPGTIDRKMAEHCRVMLETKGCSLYVAPAVFRSVVVLYGLDMVSINIETSEQNTSEQNTVGRTFAGVLFFSDPPNGDIVEQFRQIERTTERRMVAVHKIRFPEDAEPTAKQATR